MKKKLFLTAITISIITTQAIGQNNCDLVNHYENFISIKKSSNDGKDYLVKAVNRTEVKSCYSDFVNNNIMFIDYLLTNFSSNANYENLILLTDSTTLKKAYFTDLKNDSVFNSVMGELVSKTVNKDVPKDTVTMDALLNIAVKYFSILRITNDGNYVGKVCVGLNDIKKTESQRNPFVEAFSFVSILNHYQSEEFNMNEEFIKAIKELYKVNLGIDKNEKLLRAQGAIFLLMRNNENLKRMLQAEYEKHKNYLPFILTY